MHVQTLINRCWLFVFILVSTCLATYLYWLRYHIPVIGIDDANIYFIYMRNLAQGHGFVYNVGGERVEGFTSFLWVLTGSFFYLFTATPEIIFLFLNIMIVTCTLWKVCVFVADFFQDHRAISPQTVFIVFGIFIIPGYVDWGILSLMETGLWSFLLVSAVLCLCNQYLHKQDRSSQLSIILFFLVLTRPESYVWGLVFIGIQCMVHRYVYDKKWQPVLRSACMSFLVFLCTALLITGFRLAYFGYPFPNTYYAKVSSDYMANIQAGIKYVAYFFHTYTIHKTLLALALLFTVIYTLLGQKKAAIFLIFLLVTGVCFLIPLYSGGDHFRLARLIQPLMPLLFLWYILCAGSVIKFKKVFAYPVMLILLTGLCFSSRVNILHPMGGDYSITHEYTIANGGRIFSGDLNLFFKENGFYPSQGIHTSGAAAYVYKGISIDLLGLNNVKMAHASKRKQGMKSHASFNVDTFYELHPDLFFTYQFYEDTAGFVLYETTEDYKKDIWTLNLYKGILQEKKFRDMYMPVFIFKKDSRLILHTYAHKDFLTRLKASEYSYTIIPR